MTSVESRWTDTGGRFASGLLERASLEGPFALAHSYVGKHPSAHVETIKSPREKTTAMVQHAHFSVPEQLQTTIAHDSEWTREDICDVYYDTPNCRLCKNNLWLRVRDGKRFAFKRVCCDSENIMDYFEIRGPIDELATLGSFPRMLLMAMIVRFRNARYPNAWIDFATLEDDCGQTVYDWVATVHESASVPAIFGTPRCGSTFLAMRWFHADVYYDSLKSNSDNTIFRSPDDKLMPGWPEWQEPPSTLSKGTEKELHECFIKLLDEEFSDADECDSANE